MRHGRKSSSQRFDGYKLSAAATNTAEPLITAVDVAPAGEHDGARAGRLIDDQPEHRRPPRILGVTAYGVGSVREGMTARKIRGLCTGARAAASRGALGQARLHHRFGDRDGDLSGWSHRADQHRSLGTPTRAVQQGSLRALHTARAMPRTAQHVQAAAPQPARGAADGRTPSTPRPRHRRASAPHTAANRAAARPARSPLQSPQEPLHRQPQSLLQAAWTAALVNLNSIRRHLAAATA